MLDLAHHPLPTTVRPAGRPTHAPDAPAVLVIDDDPVHRTVLCKTAERAGFVPTPAASFGAAVSLLRREGFAAITLDLSLGTRNGLDVLHVLAEIGYRTPIVIVSGSCAAMRSETASMAALMRLDVRHTLAKPVDLTLLRQVLTVIRNADGAIAQRLPT